MAICVPAALIGASSPAQATPPPGYQIYWSDNFSQAIGTAPSSSNWNYDLGGGGWGNGELETYTNSLANAHVISDLNATDGSALQIQAINQGGGNYTSARIHTNNKVSVQYGYIEARMRLPYGQGIWPAFWMLGSNLNSVGWPICGEMDIMETIDNQVSTNHGSMHGPGYSGGSALTALFNLPGGQQFNQGYHTFGILWQQDSVSFYVDNSLYETRTPADVPAGDQWVYNHPFFFILNLAVGGYWPGNPDSTTVFPQNLLVDYVRAYQYTGLSTPVRFDFNQDGKSDILWENSQTGQLLVWDMNNSAIVGASGVFATVPDTHWKVVATPDVNGDGKPDLLWWNSATGQVKVWLMNGTTVVNNGNVFATANSGWQPVAVGDNQGSNWSLWWQNSLTGQVLRWRMTGTTITNAGGVIATVPLKWHIVGAPDLEGDGHSDLLWWNSSTGQMLAWYMNDQTLVNPGQVFATVPNTNWQPAGIPDLNGDGNADLLWWNRQTGQILRWQMNGSLQMNDGAPFETVATGWEPAGLK